MKGIISVTVKDKRNVYKFDLSRNITILTGDSGRGKTTLFDMVWDSNNYENSSVKIICDRPVIAVSGRDWDHTISSARNSIILIDEDNEFVRTKEFAHLVNGSSNYFLIITRSTLEQLPISVTEIYELEGAKNKKFKRVYKETDGMYHAPSKRNLPFVPEVIITEDSKTGFQFFSTIAQNAGIKCVSASGKSSIVHMLEQFKDKKVLVIADGAAFGSNMRNLVLKQETRPKMIGIYLPESFEWLILKSGLTNDPEWEKVSFPERFVESEKHFSWERYFTELLVENTRGSEYKAYPVNKGKLPEFYLQNDSIESIKSVMKGIDFGEL